MDENQLLHEPSFYFSKGFHLTFKFKISLFRNKMVLVTEKQMSVKIIILWVAEQQDDCAVHRTGLTSRHHRSYGTMYKRELLSTADKSTTT